MTANVSYRLTGPCLSLLLQDCECSESDQVGFLIGEQSSITSRTISDAEMHEERIETTITINGTFPIGLPVLFCSPLGRVNKQILKDVLGTLEKDVVGWYSFRRNSNHDPTLRESFLHRELIKVLQHVESPDFLFCIITTTTSEELATHSKRFSYYTLKHRVFQPVSVIVTNLGEPEENVYKRSTAVNNSYKHLQEVFNSVNGVNSSEAAMSTLHSEINKHVVALESSVSKLQHKLDIHLNRSSLNKQQTNSNHADGLLKMEISQKRIQEFRNASYRRKEDLKRKKEEEGTEETAWKKALLEKKELLLKNQIVETEKEELSLK